MRSYRYHAHKAEEAIKEYECSRSTTCSVESITPISLTKAHVHATLALAAASAGDRRAVEWED